MTNIKKVILATVLGIVVVLFLSIFSMGISARNKNAQLTNLYNADSSKIESFYDNLWKTINQQNQVSEKYKESFKEIIQIEMKAREDKGGLLLKFTQESNPTISTQLYSQLMNTIQTQREGFMNTQNALLDVVREQNTLLQTWPSSIFLSSYKKLSYKVISSEKTQDVIKSKQENDIKIQ